MTTRLKLRPGSTSTVHHSKVQPSATMAGSDVNRESTLVLDRQFRFLAGVPTLAQTVNGEVYPFVPAIEVSDPFGIGSAT